MCQLLGERIDEPRTVAVVVADTVDVDPVVGGIGVDLEFDSLAYIDADIGGKTLDVFVTVAVDTPDRPRGSGELVFDSDPVGRRRFNRVGCCRICGQTCDRAFGRGCLYRPVLVGLFAEPLPLDAITRPPDRYKANLAVRGDGRRRLRANCGLVNREDVAAVLAPGVEDLALDGSGSVPYDRKSAIVQAGNILRTL